MRKKFEWCTILWFIVSMINSSFFEVEVNAGFRLTCRLPHCRFDDDISSTAQASLAAEGWPSGKQRQANRSITLPLCPPRQITDSWILFNSGAIAARWKDKAALPLRAATLKQQAMITRRSGKAASGKLVWNQHKVAVKVSSLKWSGGALCACAWVFAWNLNGAPSSDRYD